LRGAKFWLLHKPACAGHNAADHPEKHEQTDAMPIVMTNAARMLAAAILLSAGAAAAQQPAPRPPAPRPAPPPQHSAQAPAAPAAPAPQTSQTPQRTTASYGDWVVRCETQTGPPPQKACDMEQLAQVQGQTSPISRVAIPLPAKGEPLKLFVQLPVNASLVAPIRITTDAKDAGISTPFRRCVPAGCFGELELKDDVQKKFRAATEAAGKIQFKDAGERDVAIPLSFKGFAQAFDALLKQ
jgi:invasion protein IalB